MHALVACCFFVGASDYQTGAIRYNEWTATYFVKSHVKVEGGGVIKQSCYESHTGTAAPKNTARCLEKILVEWRDEESEQPRVKVAWVVAMQGAVMVLDCIG